ncbi:DUF3592 domain-containing protein [Dactylosporangium sp. NPDC048998]|uniref:DUF3592 domain-containing protein n=1 Tax=Dactylosporangium sp. NPDC048998 TaxID=3363976 RepID=UPI00371FECCC
MAIGSTPIPASLGWALVGAVVAVGAGVAVGLGAYRRNRRILRRGARLSAEIVAAEIAPLDRPYGSRLRNVRLRLRFEGIEEHVLEFLGYRLRSDDAAALTPGATVQVWVLPEDLSEVRVARPGNVDRILPFQAAPEVSGNYPDGGIDGLGTLLDRSS